MIKKLLSDIRGATMLEFTLVFPLVLGVMFSIVEFGYIMFQYNAAVKATQIGAQYAATHTAFVDGLNDCGTVEYSDKSGTDCASVTGYDGSWSVSCPGGANCNATIAAEILAIMQNVYPNLEADNVVLSMSGDPGLGYIGRGRPVPAVTVAISGLSYDYIAIGGIVNFFLDSANFSDSLDITTAQTTVIAEDLREGV